MELGRHTEVVDEITAVVEEHPLREPLAGLLMLALYRCGRPGESIQCYHRVRRVLRDDLGLDPGPELQRLYGEILVADPALDHRPTTPTGRNDLPRDVADFTGREAELHRLTSGDRAGSTLLICAVDGMAGVGKSALVVRAAHRLSDRFGDGQLFVDLHGYTAGRQPLTPEAALGMLLRAVGVPDEAIPKGVDEMAARWRAELAGRRVLVVLDNAYDTAQVTPLLPGSAHCMVLITSRRRLVGLDGAETLSLDVLPEADAVTLFSRITRRDPDGATEDVAEVTRLCGYLPLAIGLAGARLRNRPTWTVAHLSERLRDERRRPGLLQSQDYGVNAALAVSYEHLPPPQQRMYRMLGLHPGQDIDAYSAAALTGEPRHVVEDVLEALCDAHLLTQPTVGRYRLHDLVRDYARASVEADEPAPHRALAQQRLLDYYLHLTEIAGDLVMPGRAKLGPPPSHPPSEVPALTGVSQAMSWFQDEYDNLRAVVAMAVERDGDARGWQIGRHFAAYQWRYGHFDSGIHTLETALTALRSDTDPAACIVFLVNLALMHTGRGGYRVALGHLDRALSLARTSGDQAMEAAVLAHMASHTVLIGQAETALGLASRAIEINRSLGLPTREAEALTIALGILPHLGRYSDAIEWGTRALALLDGTTDDLTEATIVSRMGTAHSHLAQHDLAISALHRAIDIAREANDRRSQGSHLHRLADALRRCGRLDDALHQALRALDINHGAADPTDLVETHIVLGDIHRDLGGYDEAHAHYRQAHALAATIEYRSGQDRALDGLGTAVPVVA